MRHADAAACRFSAPLRKRGAASPGNCTTQALNSPDLDARILIGHALGLDHAALAAAGARRLGAEEKSTRSPRWRIAASPTSRSPASSAAKSSGACRFVLTPQRWCRGPETETVVEAALGAIDARGPRSRVAAHCRPRHRLSAHSLLALLTELENAHEVGSDAKSRRTSRLRRENARRLGLGARGLCRHAT